MKPDLKTIKWRSCLYFFVFSILILSALWLLQIVFLKANYESRRIKDVQAAADMVSAALKTPDFNDSLDQIAYKYDIAITIFKENGNSIDYFSSSSDVDDVFGVLSKYKGLLQSLQNIKSSNLKQYIDKIKASKEGTFLANIKNTRLGNVIYVYGMQVDDMYVFFHTVLAPMNATISILRDQLLLVSMAVVLLSIVFSLIFSRKIARPLEKITEASRSFARGDFSRKFEGGSYTETVQLAESLNFAAKELSTVDSLRKELVANVSHDLRTPLTMIKSCAEMIRDFSWNNKSKRERHLKVIIEETNRLSRLVDDLLNLSRLEDVKFTLHATYFDLTEKIRIVLHQFSIYEERDGYHFTFECQEPAFVSADEDKIEQVLYNLIGNAVNHTGENNMITVRQIVQNGWVRVEVSDTGEGIPPEQLKFIWERYYKVDKTHKLSAAGTGLGLSIVKKILERHNAKFGAYSTEQGSVFWFELQMAQRDA